MLTTIDQFAGQDIWVYAELDEFSEDTYIRVQQVLDDEVIFNAAFSNDGDDIDEILYGELTSDIDSIEIHPLDTLTTDELIAKIQSDVSIKSCSKITSSKQFTKYPSNYVKASTETNPYVKDLAEYLDYLSDSEISALKVDTYNGDMEPTIWLVIPEHLRNTVENAVGIDLCTPSEDYFYQIEYHPDDDSIFFGIDTDLNVETLSVSKQTEDRFKDKFKKELGESVFSTSTVKASSDNLDQDYGVRSNYVKASRHWGEKTECKTKNGKIVRMQNTSSIFNGQDYYILYDADGNFVEKSLDFNDLHDKLYGIKASNYVNAAKGGRTYTAFYNGEIFDVSSDCDALIKQLKAEIDEAIAAGGAEDIDFGECWVELDSNEEVMYIADGDDDYAKYL